MKIKTKYFGEIEVIENEIVHFPYGLFGFENSTSFVIIRFDNDNDGFLCLQSTTDEMLAFVILNPFYAEPDYNVRLSDDDLESIGAGVKTPLAVYAIVVVRDNCAESTVNLKCPIIVNLEQKIAKQVILDTEEYSMRSLIINTSGYSRDSVDNQKP